MNLTSNYLPLLSLVIGVSASFAAYGADAPAGEQVVQEPAAIAPTLIAVPPAIEMPVTATPVPANPSATSAATTPTTTSATTPEAVEKKPDSAPKPVLSEKEQKKLRDEIIYRTSLGRASDVKILLEQGASVDETNQSGVPLISLASSRTDAQGIDVVKTLLEAKADINKVDSRGRNALFYAAKSGNRKTVEYLLAKNIKYAAVDSAGYNARVIAYQTGNNEIVEILDGFVRGQNEAIRKQYDEANKEIAEKYKQYNDKIQAQLKKEADEQNKIKHAASQTGAIQEAVRGLSFSSCSASYWQFCYTVKQQTQFDAKGIVNNINSQNNRATEFLNSLIKTYYIRSDVAQNILSVSADVIKTQLSEFATNEERKDNGIGTVDDMQRRCSLIADTWQAAPKKADK